MRFGGDQARRKAAVRRAMVGRTTVIEALAGIEREDGERDRRWARYAAMATVLSLPVSILALAISVLALAVAR